MTGIGKKKRNRLLIACVSAGAAMFLYGCPKAQHNARGLEQEFEPFFRAYAIGDAELEDRAFMILVLPKSNRWFAGYFAKTDVQQLGWDYEAEVEAYKRSLLNVMRMVANGKQFHAHCEPSEQKSLRSVQPRADAVRPTRNVPVEQFEIEFVSENGRKFSELCNFVYENGAFRYVGKGAYPFWSMPDATRNP